LDGKGEINGAPANMCSAPENRDRFPYATLKQTLSSFRSFKNVLSASIDRAIDRVNCNRWAGRA